MSWLVEELDTIPREIHTVPLDDIKPHDRSSLCPCGPVVESHSHASLVIHNSFDGREFREQAEKHAFSSGKN